MIARNEQTGKTEYKKALRTTVKQADVVVAVTLADAKTGQAVETITSTRLHFFYVEGKGFVPAGAPAIGNSIVTRAGPALVVKSVKVMSRVFCKIVGGSFWKPVVTLSRFVCSFA